MTSRMLDSEHDQGFEPQYDSITFNDFNSLDADRRYFLKLPDKFAGNQINSYGGNLTFTLEFVVPVDDNPSVRDVDIEIVSGNDRMYHLFSETPKPYQENMYSIPIMEKVKDK